MTEIWKPIKGFEDYYEVSDRGLIWSKYRHRLLRPSIDRYGYEKVTLSVGGQSFYRTVHRLVAQTFIENPNKLPAVNHINEIKTDNRVENLEWVDVATNDNHGTRNQRMADTKCKKPVVQVLKDGSTIVYKGVKDAWRKTGINRACISACCNKIRKTAGGYEWRYVNEEC